ncbi:MAG: mechanosensitive ion channel [Proteobacteria bacterium]|nr:mechanosensitive ion channel [Pseudomonadota bacterium]
MTLETVLPKVWELLTVYGLKIVAALAILIIGRWVAKIMSRVIHRVMDKRSVDPILTTFVFSLTYYFLLAFFVLAALGQLGIQTTSFVALIGAAGLAVALALQGSLSNFAAGILMLIFRPFKIDDYIEGAGVGGTVEKIQIFTTQVKTPDNKTIIIPNAKLTEGNIVNYSTKGTRRLDMVFSIGYGDDIDKAKAIMAAVLDEDPRVLKDPAPTIGLLELANSSVNFAVRPWVQSSDYWNVHFEVTEKIKKRFDEEGVSIPFPQRDVHVFEHKT